MRNRRQTIESLRRLAERPGTPAEGDLAYRLMNEMLGRNPAIKPFSEADFPKGTAVFYNRWAYPQNDPCVVLGKSKVIAVEIWIRMRFEHLKQPRWVPITSRKGCHISKDKLSPQDADWLYHSWKD